MAKAERLDLRLSEEDDRLIRWAAKVQGRPISSFVVSAARSVAEDVLADRTHFFLDKSSWKQFQRKLARPPAVKPELGKLLQEPDIFE